MILIIAVLAILLLIACVGWWGCYRSKQLAVAASEFDRSAANTLEYQLHEERLRVNNLKAELAEPPLPAPVTEEEPEQGNFVKRKAIRRATPETYRNVFDLDINGQRVIEHLQLTFANKSTYVRGGQDAERESCFKAGQANVIGFIFNQINQANNPDYKEEIND